MIQQKQTFRKRYLVLIIVGGVIISSAVAAVIVHNIPPVTNGQKCAENSAAQDALGPAAELAYDLSYCSNPPNEPAKSYFESEEYQSQLIN